MSKETPIFEVIDDLTAGSAKIGELLKIAEEVDVATRPNQRYNRNDAGGTQPKTLPAKFLVLTYKPVTQLVTFQALRKVYGFEDMLMLPGGLMTEELTERLKAWSDPDGARFMVCSMAYAEAITLIEATHVVIMEPQDRQAKQDQGLFRIYRLGQIAFMCYGYVLFNPECQEEADILARQQTKTTSRLQHSGWEERRSGDDDWRRYGLVG
jgi:hypothetical protein